MPSSKPRRALHITPTSFRPTLLSIPPSPFSPRTPLTPKPQPSRQSNHYHNTYSNLPTPASSAPNSPLPWTWQCHQCHRSYLLSATRRCLEDGHTYCSGSTTVRAWREGRGRRRTKRGRACASEFDFAGWKELGRWKRSGIGKGISSREVGGGTGKKKNKNCWTTCDYPSECIWERRHGVHNPVEEGGFPEVHGLGIDFGAQPTHLSEGLLRAENIHPPKGTEKLVREGEGKTDLDLWGLLASAKRRKSGQAREGSPLVKAENASSNNNEVKEKRDCDGDVVMGNIDPALLLLSEPVAPPPQSTRSSAAVDMLKDLIKRRSSRRGVLVKGEEDVTMGNPETMMDGFAPLERVRIHGIGVRH
ncbi:hypothetical protein EK21DRAFT_101604 [Setomelanomma holmii]|uniref:Uncharacterized protein n=1 Tax=Setomelanomma holmii TaxID=210430 RepID=A0A9P4LJ24_9PLEO|nr:hypothetical protein EK21DRAFT_101604 [Setomelanomma holmii]